MRKKKGLFPKKIRSRWYLATDKEKKSVTETCQMFGISRKTYYKWRKRDLGKDSVSYQARRNHPDLKLAEEVREFIKQEKLRLNYGPLKMKLGVEKKLGMELSTTLIYRFYKKKKVDPKTPKEVTLVWTNEGEIKN